MIDKSQIELPQPNELRQPVLHKCNVTSSAISETYLMDCIEGMKHYPDKWFDLAVVDPPYGIGMDNQHKRTKPNRPNSYTNYKPIKYNISKWDNEVPTLEYFTELYRVSKEQIIWGANYFCQMIPNGKGWIYWDKQMGDNNFSSGEFAYQSLQIKSSCFSYPSDRSQERIHPTEKPITLYDWIFTRYAEEGQRVLDTHLGSGSSRIAAHKNKLNFVGFEIDKEYFDKQEKRFANYVSQLRMF